MIKYTAVLLVFYWFFLYVRLRLKFRWRKTESIYYIYRLVILDFFFQTNSTIFTHPIRCRGVTLHPGKYTVVLKQVRVRVLCVHVCVQIHWRSNRCACVCVFYVCMYACKYTVLLKEVRVCMCVQVYLYVRVRECRCMRIYYVQEVNSKNHTRGN